MKGVKIKMQTSICSTGVDSLLQFIHSIGDQSISVSKNKEEEILTVGIEANTEEVQVQRISSCIPC